MTDYISLNRLLFIKRHFYFYIAPVISISVGFITPTCMVDSVFGFIAFIQCFWIGGITIDLNISIFLLLLIHQFLIKITNHPHIINLIYRVADVHEFQFEGTVSLALLKLEGWNWRTRLDLCTNSQIELIFEIRAIEYDSSGLGINY